MTHINKRHQATAGNSDLSAYGVVYCLTVSEGNRTVLTEKL
jgi:hypothetical protein